MPSRSYVQVATDGTGKKIANVAVTDPSAPDSSGNATADTVTYQQVTTLADKRGDLVSGMGQVVAELQAMNETLQEILAALS